MSIESITNAICDRYPSCNTVIMTCCGLPHHQCICWLPCDDCGEQYQGRVMADTMAAILCPACNKRFMASAQKLAERYTIASYAELVQLAKAGEMQP